MTLPACAAIVLCSLIFYCSPVLAQCTLDIQSPISSGWNKEGVSYAVENNTLKIKVREGNRADTDSIFIGSIRGCSTLTVAVTQISGEYPWGGKAIGLSFANDPIQAHQWGNQASFPAPRGEAIEDGFIKAGLANKAQLVYDIDNSAGTTYFGAKVFIGSNNVMELQFSAQEAARPLQASTPPAPREARPGTQQVRREVQQSGVLPASRPMRFGAPPALPPSEHCPASEDYALADPDMSCAGGCHRAGIECRPFLSSRGFSIACRPGN